MWQRVAIRWKPIYGEGMGQWQFSPVIQVPSTPGKMSEIYTSWFGWISTMNKANWKKVCLISCVFLCGFVNGFMWLSMEKSIWFKVVEFGVCFYFLILLPDTHTWNVRVNFQISYSLYKTQEKPLSFSSSSSPLHPAFHFFPPSLSQHRVQGGTGFVSATALAWDLSWPILLAAAAVNTKM